VTAERITTPVLASAATGVWHCFGTREGPIRLDELLASPGLSFPGARRPRDVVSVRQVHGTDVLVVDRQYDSRATETGGWDAMVTDQPDVLLTVRTADCVPVLLYDPRRRVIGAIHAGWRGAVAGIVPKTIDLLRERFDSRPDSLLVGIGPAIGACCYEVDEPVLGPLREGFADWRSVVTLNGADRGMLDLRALVRRQAVRAGVRPDQISSEDLCTACRPDLFFSYRRDGAVIKTMVHGIMLTD
jgi:YfiH family protein